MNSSPELNAGCSLRPAFDIVILDGTVIDGTGKPAQKIDVGIRDDKITAIDNLKEASAKRRINADGLIVAPGFIDIHTHTDIELLVNPTADSKIHQGVTTEVAGNCGSSYFPLNDRDSDFDEYNQLLSKKYGLEIVWRDAAGLFDAVERRKTSINYATFVGQGQIRRAVVGNDDVSPTPDQMARMKRLLEIALEQGCVGMSTGLEYAPSSYARTDELIDLCNVVARYDRVHASHMRNEDDTVEEAIAEVIHITQKTGVSLQISHLKASNEANWHKAERFINTLQDAIDAGIPVHADRYPYVASATGLNQFLPGWARQGATEEVLARLDHPGDREKIRKYAENRGIRIGGWNRVNISSCVTDEGKQWEGRTIGQCCESLHMEPFAFIVHLLKTERNRVGMVSFTMDESNLYRVLQAPFVMVGSDGNAVAPTGTLGEGKPHPRFYGTFPRVLGRYCRDKKRLDWPVAIEKMTSMPADKLGFEKRGRLRVGCFADVTVFNPQTIIDRATFIEPNKLSEGIEYVFVNGELTVENGKHTGALGGTIIKK